MTCIVSVLLFKVFYGIILLIGNKKLPLKKEIDRELFETVLRAFVLTC